MLYNKTLPAISARNRDVFRSKCMSAVGRIIMQLCKRIANNQSSSSSFESPCRSLMRHRVVYLNIRDALGLSLRSMYTRMVSCTPKQPKKYLHRVSDRPWSYRTLPRMFQSTRPERSEASPVHMNQFRQWSSRKTVPGKCLFGLVQS